jgi:hypothetical protein
MRLLLSAFCVLLLFSCSTTPKKTKKIIQSETITKYDITATGFSTDVISGLVDELSESQLHVKHNVLELKNNLSILTYTIKGDNSNVGDIKAVMTNYFTQNGISAKIDYASGMFKISKRD